MPRIAITPSVLRQWHRDESSSWEDAGDPAHELYGQVHAYDILGRHKTFIEWQSADEYRKLVNSADFFSDCPADWDNGETVAYRRALGQFLTRLRAVCPDCGEFMKRIIRGHVYTGPQTDVSFCRQCDRSDVRLSA